MMIDNDSPVALGGISPQGFAQMYAKKVNDFSQAGTGIRPLHLQNREEQEAGGPIFNQFSVSGTPDFESMGFTPGSTTIAGSPSFQINKGSDALGKRSGEQLLRLQQGSGDMQNEQLQRELERRMLLPRGVSLPPV